MPHEITKRVKLKTDPEKRTPKGARDAEVRGSKNAHPQRRSIRETKRG
jgi:hypothetical protein